MFKSITIKNFFSFKEKQQINLSPSSNVLVGINGSGKSNFLKAITLLQEGTKPNRLSRLIAKWGGFNALSYASEEKDKTVSIIYEIDKNVYNSYSGFVFRDDVHSIYYAIDMHLEGENGYYLSEAFYTVSQDQYSAASYPKPACELSRYDNPEFILLRLTRGRGVMSTRLDNRTTLEQIPGQLESDDGNEPKELPLEFETELALSQSFDPKRYYALWTLKKMFEDITAYPYIDTTPGSPMRSPNPISSKTRLSSNGENIAALLHNFKKQKRSVYQEIEKSMKEVNPTFRSIEIDPQGNDTLLLYLAEQSLERLTSPIRISDGTLRYLCLLSIISNPDRGSLVCFDEPEIGLHPDMIYGIAKKIDRSEGQSFIATHSPIFLNAFEIEDLLVFTKNEENSTEVKRPSYGDLADELQEYSTGELWMMGHLGGVRY